MTTQRKRPIQLLTPEEVQALFRAASRRSASGVRARALMACWYRAGLRLAESLALVPADLDLDRGQINVRRGKGGKQRIAAIDAGGAELLAEWMRWRRKLGLGPRHPVFATYSQGTKGQMLTSRQAQQTVQRLAARAGLEKRVTPHLLRHCHAAELERDGMRTTMIKDQLGHSSLATTQVYLDHISPTERVESIRGRESWSA